MGVGPSFQEVSPTETTDYTLTCSGPGGVPDVFTVTVVVDSEVLVNVNASRDRIGAGQTTRLSWNPSNANSCSAVPNSDPAWTGALDPNSGFLDVSPTQDTTYVLNCLGDGLALGSGSVAVEIADPIVVSLTSSDPVIAPGASATLTWGLSRDVDSVTTCTSSASPPDGSWSGSRNPNGGSRAVSPAEDTTYQITCMDQFYTGATSSVLVEIAPIPTVTLTASQDLIAAGGMVELTWTSTDADRCEPTEPWTDEEAPTSGSAFVSPLVTTRYEMLCFGLHQTPGSNEDDFAEPVFVIVDPNRAVKNTASWAEDVEVRPDDIAVVATREDGLRILDVTTVETPMELGSFDPGTCINDTPFGSETEGFRLEDVEIDPVDRDLVYLSAGRCGMWLVMLDEANGYAQPSVVSIVDTEGWTEHVTVVGGFAFVSDYFGGVLIFDVTDPLAPVELRNVAFNDEAFGGALEIQVVGNYAFVASNLGLRVIDVAIPAEAELVAEVDMDVDRGFIPQGILVYNDLAYVSSWTGGLLYFDVSDPRTPLPAGLSGRIAATESAFYKLVVLPGVDLEPDLLYIAEGELGIRVLDISNADFGEVTDYDQIDIGRFVWDIGITNGDLYVGFIDLAEDPDEFVEETGGFQTIIDRP